MHFISTKGVSEGEAMSQFIEAKCKECQCRFVTHIDHALLYNASIIGVCENCSDMKSHDCIDEFQEDENHCYLKVGRREFPKVR